MPNPTDLMSLPDEIYQSGSQTNTSSALTASLHRSNFASTSTHRTSSRRTGTVSASLGVPAALRTFYNGFIQERTNRLSSVIGRPAFENKMTLKKSTLGKQIIRPRGMFALHLKTGQFHDIDTDGYLFSHSANVSVYVRVSSTTQSKLSCVYTGLSTPVSVLFDDLMHFDFTVDPQRKDAAIIRIAIMAFDINKPQESHVLAVKELSQMKIIQSNFLVETIELWKQERLVAELNIEVCFTYGSFGFGYSSLFLSPGLTKPSTDQIKHSMFCRRVPPSSRSTTAGGVVLQPAFGRPIRPIDLIYLTCNIQLDSALVNGNSPEEDFGDVVEVSASQLPLVYKLMVPRMLTSRAEYSKLSSRQDRLSFLVKRVSSCADHSTAPHSLLDASRQCASRQPTDDIFAVSAEDWKEEEATILGALVNRRRSTVWREDGVSSQHAPSQGPSRSSPVNTPDQVRQLDTQDVACSSVTEEPSCPASDVSSLLNSS